MGGSEEWRELSSRRISAEWVEVIEAVEEPMQPFESVFRETTGSEDIRGTVVVEQMKAFALLERSGEIAWSTEVKCSL